MSTTGANQNPSASTTDVGSQLTAENRSVGIDGESFAYRRFGNAGTSAPPLVCLQHFRGNLDNWDPALVDRLARDREVILFANRGVGASTAVVPDNVTDMARDVTGFVDALGLGPRPPGGNHAADTRRHGDNDTMMITENSHLLAHHLPNAQLRIYPDAGHGFLDQYPELFADHVNAFLNGG